jgi:hypothetical protein
MMDSVVVNTEAVRLGFRTRTTTAKYKNRPRKLKPRREDEELRVAVMFNKALARRRRRKMKSADITTARARREPKVPANILTVGCDSDSRPLAAAVGASRADVDEDEADVNSVYEVSLDRGKTKKY